MKKNIFFITILLISFLSACSQQSLNSNDTDLQVDNSTPPDVAKVKTEDKTGRKVNEIDLTAKETEWSLNSETTINAWTYNGTIPGEEIRVNEGEVVKVNLTNDLEEPVSIHWHGIPVPNTEDGIPGITQDAVLPGKTYTYEFVATDPGTYWYHSHQNGVEQLDKGLYGTIIVEPKKSENIDRDYTLVLDEWESEKHGEDEEVAQTMNSAKNHGSMIEHDMSSYDIFTINGKTYEDNKPLLVKKGETVKLRFVNAGYMTHQIHVPVNYKITHLDGQKVNNPQTMHNSIFEVAPGERVDIKFIADGNADFTIDSHDETEASEAMKINISYEDKDEDGKKIEHSGTSDQIDITKIGEQTETMFSLKDDFDVEYEMDLAAKMKKDTEMGMVWTINDEVFPDVPPLKVSKGDKVKVTLSNNSIDESIHPMHLHGHFFQVLRKNGKELTNSPIMKDTLNVKPGETYEVAFLADNPGNWLFHCHDLHHASNGMVSLVKYNNFDTFYKDTGKVDNLPE